MPLAGRSTLAAALLGASTSASKVQIATHWLALIAGLLSSITLPGGALLGVCVPKLPQATIALIVAFGAGCLLFAVTVELYGESLTELGHHGYVHGVSEIGCMVAGALLGAALYILVAKWLDRVVTGKYFFPGSTNTPTPDTEYGWSRPGTPLTYDSEGASSSQPASRDPVRVASSRREARGHGKENERTTLVRARSRITSLLTREGVVSVRGRKKAVLGALAPLFTRERRPTRKRKPSSTIECDSDSDGPLPVTATDNIRVAIAIWLGVLLDGIPEGILIGFLAAEEKLSTVLVVAIMIANFPESFASGMMLREVGVGSWRIVAMWFLIFVITGLLACFTAWALPENMLNKETTYRTEFWYLRLMGATIEGIAGGAMLACIANVMLPDAFRKRGDMVGMLMLVGFLLSMLLKVFGGYVTHFQNIQS